MSNRAQTPALSASGGLAADALDQTDGAIPLAQVVHDRADLAHGSSMDASESSMRDSDNHRISCP